ncbi:MAG: hypothetical protein SGJ24_02665 [Chloroflexota bacterium]|nr:hypothetical protein [Chloroflexota bacterium]
MTDDLLAHVQQLQFTDRRAAEKLLVPFLREAFPLDVRSVTLRPLAVSLNSFNGFASLADGSQVFFKTHIEADGVIDEYYNADLLHQAGYNVLQPRHVSRQVGRQILVYPMIDCPSVFDAAWSIETGELPWDDRLLAAQHQTDARLYTIYHSTLREQSAVDAARAPIHQLFYHRLTGGRLDRFYGDGTQITWQGEAIAMHAVRSARWVINGRAYTDTLDDLIAKAIVLLDPVRSGAAVVGHGDAHNGNVFYCADHAELTYFDPAFAGTHDPLLDLTKPLFHNVFAMWMYHPRWFEERMSLTVSREGQLWRVDHDYVPHPIRTQFLQSKVARVLAPTLALLKMRGLLRPDWHATLKSALLCCPLLTMNLTDRARFPESIALLGLAYAVEMGSSADGVLNAIDHALAMAETMPSSNADTSANSP